MNTGIEANDNAKLPILLAGKILKGLCADLAPILSFSNKGRLYLLNFFPNIYLKLFKAFFSAYVHANADINSWWLIPKSCCMV